MIGRRPSQGGWRQRRAGGILEHSDQEDRVWGRQEGFERGIEPQLHSCLLAIYPTVTPWGCDPECRVYTS
jgi:hypothetical protein